jgi:hypothetical protein
MNNTLEDSGIDRQREAKPDSDVAMIRDEINQALKRMEKSLDASKAALSDTLEEGKISAERLLNRGRNLAASYIDDATYQVKRNPQAAVALAFGLGAAAVVLFGLLTRCSRTNFANTDDGR